MMMLRRNKPHWHNQLALGILLALVGSTTYAATVTNTVITPQDTKFNNTVTTNGNVTNVTNQTVETKVAVNHFNQFDVGQQKVVNMQLGNVNSQINVIHGDMNVSGVLNTIKDGKIGGNALFISSGGIAIDRTGVINAGNLGLVAGTDFKKSAQSTQNYLAAATGTLNLDGTINTTGGLSVAAKNIVIGQTGIINGRANFNTPVDNTWTADQYKTNLVNTNGLGSATSVTAQADGSVTLEDGSTMTNDVVLKANTGITLNGTVLTNGGNFQAIATTDSDGGGIITIDGTTGKISTRTVADNSLFANHETAVSIGKSGNITIQATRSNKGTSIVNLGALKILGNADGTYQGGNAFIGAEATTNLAAWASLSDKTEADVTLSGTDVTAGRVQVAAYASNNFDLKDTSATVVDSNGNIVSGAGKYSIDDDVLAHTSGSLLDYVNPKTARAFVVDSNVLSKANVIIKDATSLTTKGNAAVNGEDTLTRDVLVTASSSSGTRAVNYALIGSIAIGVSEADAAVNLAGNTKINAADSIGIAAKGANSSELTNMDFDVLSSLAPVNLALNWVQLDGDISADVDATTQLTAGKKIDVTSALTRTLSSNLSNSATKDVLGISIGVLKSNTNVTANVLGTTTANGGAVTVSADNTPVSNNGGKSFNAANNVVAVSMGNTFGNPVINTGINAVMSVVDSVKKCIKKASGDKTTVVSSLSASTGLGMAFAYSSLKDTATATLGGNVHAGDVSVTARTVERPKTLSNSDIGNIPKTDSTGSMIDPAVRKTAEAIALGFDFTEGDATAEILDGTTVALNGSGNGNVDVTATIKIPYDNVISTFDSSSFLNGVKSLGNDVWTLLGNNMGVDSFLFDNWVRSSAQSDEFSTALSSDWTKYTNTANASIGKGVTISNAGNVNVLANVEVDTVNLSGIFDFPLKSVEAWKKGFDWKRDMFGNVLGNSSSNGVGGSLMKTEYINTATATIGKANTNKATTGKTTINATGDITTKGTVTDKYIVVAASGGTADGNVAFDGDVSLGWVTNTTKADIYNTDITTSGNVAVNAIDTTHLYTYGIACDIGQSSGVGASVSYNSVNRDTEAHFSGTINNADAVQISAKNDGAILAVAVSGVVSTKTSPTNKVQNAAVVRDMGAGDDGNLGLDDLFNTYDGWYDVADDMPDAAAGVASGKKLAKSTWAVAGSVGFIYETDTAKATVDSVTGSTTTIKAKSAEITADNSTYIVSPSLNGTVNMDKGASIAGDFHLNSLTSNVTASALSSEFDLSGSRKENKTDTEESLRVHAANDNKIASAAASFAGSFLTSGSADYGLSSTSLAGQLVLNYINDTTSATLTDSNVYADYNSLIEAFDQPTIYGVGGSAAFSTSGTSMGASWVNDDITSTTEALSQNTNFDGNSYDTKTAKRKQSGNVNINAASTPHAVTVAVGAGISAGAKSFAASGSVARTIMNSHTTASLLGRKKSVHAKDISVNAADAASLTAVSGNLNVTKGTAVGAAMAWTVNKAVTTASAGGGLTIDAGNLTVKADNALNNNSKDIVTNAGNHQIKLNDSDTDNLNMAKTVAVGGSVAGGTFDGVGSVVVNQIDRTANASIASDDSPVESRIKNDFTLAGNLQVDAENVTRVFGLAGGVSVSIGGNGLGAAADWEYVTTGTTAAIGDDTVIHNAGDINVAANSKEQLVNVAAGIAGATSYFGVGAAIDSLHVNTTTKAFMGNRVALGDQTSTDPKRVGKVSVTATDTGDSSVCDVSLALNIGGTASAGAAIDWNYLTRDIAASLGDNDVIYANSLAVSAQETGTHNAYPVGAAFSKLATLEGSGSVNVVSQHVNTSVGKDTTVDTAASGGTIDVNAENAYTFKGLAGAIQASFGGAAGAGFIYNSYDGQTNAYTGTNDIFTTQDLFAVTAASSEKITDTVMEVGAAKYAAIGANVSRNTLTTATNAYTGTANTITVKNGTTELADATKLDSVRVRASDTSALSLIGGGLQASINVDPYGISGSGGIALTYNTLNKTTHAYIGDSTTIDAKYNQLINALNDEDLSSFTIQGNVAVSVFGGAVAGAVAINNIYTDTQAYLGKSVKVNQSDNATDGSLLIDANHHQVFDSSLYSFAAATIVGLSGAVNYGTFFDTTAAYIGDGSAVKETGDVSVTAENNAEKVKGKVISGSVGALGVNVNYIAYRFGIDPDDDATRYKVDGKDPITGAKELSDWSKALSGMEKSQPTMYNEILAKTKNATTDEKKTDATTTKAFIANGAAVKAKSIAVQATDTLNLDTTTGGTAVGVAAVGPTNTIIRNNRNASAYTEKAGNLETTGGNLTVAAQRNDTDTFSEFGATVGVIGVPHATYTLYDTGSSVAFLGGSSTSHTDASDGINVTANNIYSITGTNTGAGVGAVQLVFTLNNIYLNGGLTSAYIDDDTTLSAGGTVAIHADTKANVDLTAKAPVVLGSVAVGDTENVTEDTIKTAAYLGSGVHINKAGNVTVSASSTPQLKAVVSSNTIGVTGTGILKDRTTESETVVAGLHDGAVIDGADAVTVQANMFMPAGKTNSVYTEASGFGFGGIAGNPCITLDTTLDNHVTTNVGQNVGVTAGQITLTADTANRFNLLAQAKGRGVLGAGGGVNATVHVTDTTSVNVANDATSDKKTTLTATKNGITIKAHSTTERNWLTDNSGMKDANQNIFVSGKAAFGSGGGIKSDVTITHNTDVNIGYATLTGTLAVDNPADYYSKDAVTLDAGSTINSNEYLAIYTGSIGAGANLNESEPHLNTYTATSAVTLAKNSTIHSGYTDKERSSEKTAAENDALLVKDPDAYGADSVDYGGGNIAVAVSNEANIFSAAFGNVTALAGYPKVKNDNEYTGTATINANGQIETAAGDIFLMAGEDAAGTTPTVQVNSRAYRVAHTAFGNGDAKAVANITNKALINVGDTGKIFSDRNVNLISDYGNAKAVSIAEERNITDDSDTSVAGVAGTKEVTTSAAVIVNGTVSTGIHRNKVMTIGGNLAADKKTWDSTVTRDSSLGYTFTRGATSTTELITRWNQLQKLKSQYATDAAAYAGYDAESQFIEAKLVSKGRGAYDKNNHFILIEPDTISDYDRLESYLDTLSKVADSNKTAEYTEAFTKLQTMEKVSNLFYSLGGTSTVDKDNNYVFTLNNQTIDTDAKLQTALKSQVGTSGIDVATDLVMDNLVSKYEVDDTSVGQIALRDITATLGNINVRGTSLTGTGALKANSDAAITIINQSPNSLLLGNMTVTDGGHIYMNNQSVKTDASIETLNSAKDGGTVAFGTLVSMDHGSGTPSIDVENKFQASTTDYQQIVDNTDKTDYFTANIFEAPSITVATNAVLFNENGTIRLHSDEGDIYNHGTIDGGSIDINANDGDFIQSYTSGVHNVGGNPETLYNNGQWGVKAGGITANGNIFINAQYLNINGTIQSGVADWKLNVPANVDNLVVTYIKDGKTVETTIGNLTDTEKTYTLHLSKQYGNMADYVVYDPANKKLVVDNVNVHGGNVTLVGTIMNTGTGQTNGKVTGGSIIALDGYGEITLTNQSGLPLEIRNMSADTGEHGTEGSIIISDINRSGTAATVTTYKYTREAGVQKVYLKQTDGTWKEVTGTVSATSFAPQSGLIYTKITGTTTNSTRRYTESKTTFNIGGDWFNVHTGDKDAKLVDTSTTTNAALESSGYVRNGELALPDGATYVTHDANPQVSTTDTTVRQDAAGAAVSSDPYYAWMAYRISKDVMTNKNVATSRFLFLKKYIYTWDDITSTNTYSAKLFKADNPIAIGYVGSETPGTINISSNSTISLAGRLSNTAGNVILAAGGGNDIKSIKSTELINANALTFDTTGTIGTADSAIRTLTKNLSSLQQSTNLYLKNISAEDLALGSNIATSNVTNVDTGGSITDAKGYVMSAKRLDLWAEGGSLGTAAAPVKFVTEAPLAGKDADYGISARAQSDVYMSTSGSAMVDKMVSDDGNVWLYAKDGVYDNNVNESTNESVASRLDDWKNKGVLEGTDELLRHQKEILSTEVVEEYHTYLNLSARLNSTDNPLSTTERAEYDRLVAKGVNTWTKDKVEAYTPTVTKTANGIHYSYTFTDDGFLSASEQETLLKGTGVTETQLLLTLSPGIESGITDTNPVIKEYANIQGKDITLLTGTSVGDRSDSISFSVDLTKSLKTYAESEQGSSNLLALATAEKGDVTTSEDGTTFSASVRKVSPVEVAATGTVITKFVTDSGAETTPSTGNDVYLVAETTHPTVVGNISGDTVRIKTVGDLTSAADTTVSAANPNLVLESAEGNVNVNIGKIAGLTTRSGGDVVLNGTGADIPVDTIYAVGGVTINSGNGDILGLTGENKVNIKADNVQLDGNHVGTSTNVLGLELTDTTTPSNVTAQNGIDLYLTGAGVNMDNLTTTAGDIHVASTKDLALTAATVSAGGDVDLTAGSIQVGTVTGNTATLTAGTDLTATGLIHTVGNSTLQATDAMNLTDVTSDTGSISATAGDALTGNTLTALNGDIDLTAGSINVGAIYAGHKAAGTTTAGSLTVGEVTGDTADLTAKTDLTATGPIHTTGDSTLQAGNGMSLTDVTSDTGSISATAGDALTGNTLTALNGDIDLTAGSINVGAIYAGHKAAGTTTAGSLTVGEVTGDTADLTAKTDLTATGPIHTTGDSTLRAGNGMSLTDVTSDTGSISGTAGDALTGNTLTALNGDIDLTAGSINVGAIHAGHKAAGTTTAGSLTVGEVTGDTADLTAKTDLTATGPIHTTGDSTLRAGNGMELDNVTSDMGSISGTAGDFLTADTIDAGLGDVYLAAPIVNVLHLRSGDITAYADFMDLQHVTYDGDQPIQMQLQGEQGGPASSIYVRVDDSLRGVIYNHLNVKDGVLDNHTEMVTINDAHIKGDFSLSNAYISYITKTTMPLSSYGKYIAWMMLKGKGSFFDNSTYMYLNSDGIPMNDQYFYPTVEYTARLDEKHERDWWNVMQYDETGKQKPLATTPNQAQLFIDNPVVQLGSYDSVLHTDKYLWN